MEFKYQHEFEDLMGVIEAAGGEVKSYNAEKKVFIGFTVPGVSKASVTLTPDDDVDDFHYEFFIGNQCMLRGDAKFKKVVSEFSEWINNQSPLLRS